MVKTLIEANADIKARTRKGFTALHFAAREGDRDLRLLLAAAWISMSVRSRVSPHHGGDARPMCGPRRAQLGQPPIGQGKRYGGYTPLLVATVRSQVALALFLFEHGADPEHSGWVSPRCIGLSPPGKTAALIRSMASRSRCPGFRTAGQAALVKALLAHGADPNARMKRRPPVGGGYTDVDGATAFLLASSVDDVEMMQVLLAAGADPKLVTATNTTTLMAAAGLNHRWAKVR